MRIVMQFCRNESGATSIEYALIASFVSIIAVVAITGIGTRLNTKFNAVSNGLS